MFRRASIVKISPSMRIIPHAKFVRRLLNDGDARIDGGDLCCEAQVRRCLKQQDLSNPSARKRNHASCHRQFSHRLAGPTPSWPPLLKEKSDACSSVAVHTNTMPVIRDSPRWTIQQGGSYRCAALGSGMEFVTRLKCPLETRAVCSPHFFPCRRAQGG